KPIAYWPGSGSQQTLTVFGSESWELGMNSGRHDPRTSVLADLGPLPEVKESNSDTLWNTFLELQARDPSGFERTQPSALMPLASESSPEARQLTVQEVLAEARRLNRVCPIENQWGRLDALLQAAGADAPRGLSGTDFRSTPSLGKRIRLREQVEWAAERALLDEVFDFLLALPETDWVHMDR